MGSYKNVILICSDRAESFAIQGLCEYLRVNGWEMLVLQQPAGEDALNSRRVFVIEAKNLIVSVFLDNLRRLSWRHPEEVQVLVRAEEDDIFSVYTLRKIDFCNKAAGDPMFEVIEHVAGSPIQFEVT